MRSRYEIEHSCHEMTCSRRKIEYLCHQIMCSRHKIEYSRHKMVRSYCKMACSRYEIGCSRYETARSRYEIGRLLQRPRDYFVSLSACDVISRPFNLSALSHDVSVPSYSIFSSKGTMASVWFWPRRSNIAARRSSGRISFGMELMYAARCCSARTLAASSSSPLPPRSC
jgi:hypothetical protein